MNYELQPSKVDVLGVKIDAVSMEGAVERVEGWLKSQGQSLGKGHSAELSRSPYDKHYIVTPNPEFIVAAQEDLEFREVLNKADLAIPDGVGLKLANRRIEKIIPGVDLMEKLCQMAADQGFTIGFLGGKGGVAKKAAECLRKKYPKLKIVLAEDGPEVGGDGNSPAVGGWLALLSPVANLAFGGKLWRSHAKGGRSGQLVDLLFVAFGQIKQEKWIAQNLPKVPVKVAMGVGGAFDYLSGKVIRAPLWMRNLGLEWLFRLIVQPWRIERQLALLQFLWLVIKRKFK